MAYQTVFRRYELKYLLTLEQKETLLREMELHMEPDKYGRSTVRNLYYDTDTYRLIRRSIEKPIYKEKLRLRAYEQVSEDETVFAELKKKYDRVVYKRRLSLAERDAVAWLSGTAPCPVHTQISREIDYARSYYGELHPVVYLSYEREAYYSREESDFRVTFDDHILARCTDLSLCSQAYGTPLLADGLVLMEIKCAGGMPIWMAQALSREQIYGTSFSKYGTAYQTMIFPALGGEKNLNHHQGGFFK